MVQKLISIKYLYDMKPFYMMTIVSDKSVWTNKVICLIIIIFYHLNIFISLHFYCYYMEVFCQKQRKPVKVPFYHLNLADEYNNKMAKIDIGSQLRNYSCVKENSRDHFGCSTWVCY